MTEKIANCTLRNDNDGSLTYPSKIEYEQQYDDGNQVDCHTLGLVSEAIDGPEKAGTQFEHYNLLPKYILVRVRGQLGIF